MRGRSENVTWRSENVIGRQGNQSNFGGCLQTTMKGKIGLKVVNLIALCPYKSLLIFLITLCRVIKRPQRKREMLEGGREITKFQKKKKG